jgi:subtilisin family serine protease
MVAPAPRRTPVAKLPTTRRPVVAVLDTGIRPHEWLGMPDVAPDSFLSVDHALQAAIHHEELRVRDTGGLDFPVLEGYWDVPDPIEPTTGALPTHIGHGTFIAGIVRQSAPDARVRAIRVMHTDGIVHESVLLLAIRVLAAQVATALSRGDTDDVVDVVSLSLGYFDEYPEDVTYTGVLAGLTDLGVAVIAAAGNHATTQPYFPAALATQPGADPQLPVVSVGALNPNGTKAMFSNDGSWVTAWATGASVVSTYPADLNGSFEPQITSDSPENFLHRLRETLDPDDFRGGFAVWSGTSFATPLLAAVLADALLAEAREHPADPVSDLGSTDRLIARERIARALRRIGAPDHA